MKKLISVCSAGLLALSLAGCSDATASLSDAKTTLFTVGDTKVTKGDIYDIMFAGYASSEAISDAKKVICDAEIEVTDDMKEQAQDMIDTYNTYYGDSFTSYLKSNGLTEEDYMNDYLIPSYQADELTNKYIDYEWDALIEQYNPIKAIILTFSSEDDANAALSELNDGSSTAAEAAANNNSDSDGEEEIITIDTTSYDSTALSVVRTNTSDDGWSYVESSEEGVYYLVKVVSNDPTEYEDEIKDTLSGYSAVTEASTTYFFNKYGFQVYDINLYNAIESDTPEALASE